MSRTDADRGARPGRRRRRCLHPRLRRSTPGSTWAVSVCPANRRRTALPRPDAGGRQRWPGLQRRTGSQARGGRPRGPWPTTLRSVDPADGSGTADRWHRNRTRPQTGGNRPKPQNAPARRGQSAKDRSRAQSRAGDGQVPGGKTGKAAGAKPGRTKEPEGGVNRPRGQHAPSAAAVVPPAPPVPAGRRVSGAMMAWGAVGLVVVVVVVLVIVKATGDARPTTPIPRSPRPPLRWSTT